MIWLITIWLAYVLLEVSVNYWMIEVKKSKPIYMLSFIVRGMASILHGVLYNPYDLLEFLPLLGFQVSTFYLLFDPLLNLLRGKPMFYQGKSSGWLDKLSRGKYVALKIVCLVILTIAIIKLL